MAALDSVFRCAVTAHDGAMLAPERAITHVVCLAGCSPDTLARKPDSIPAASSRSRESPRTTDCRDLLLVAWPGRPATAAPANVAPGMTTAKLQDRAGSPVPA